MGAGAPGAPALEEHQRTRRSAHDELLGALAGVDLRRIDVALAVDGEVVDPVELPGASAIAAEGAEDAAALAGEHPDVVVLAVGVVEDRLLAVGREVHVPGGSVAARLGRDDELLAERSVLAKDLEAVVLPVAHVEHAVARKPHAVHGVAEALDARVALRPAVGAPVTLLGSSVGVDDEHAV